jgi:hypothetical protein
MTKLSGRFLTILALVCVPAVLAIAPSAAVAKKTKKARIINLEGPINHSKDPGYTPGDHLCCFPSFTPTIQIRATLGGKKPSVSVTEYGLWGHCSGAESSRGGTRQGLVVKPKKNGAFAGTSTEDGTAATLTVSGQIRRNGTASGTVREVVVYPYTPSGSAWGTCDSGTVTWTATKVAALTTLKPSYDPSLVYPAGY